MKKSIFILSAAAVLSACTVVAPDQGAVTSGDSSSAGQNGVTFVGAALESPVEAGADGKTYFGPASGSSYGVNWSNDDTIQINGYNSTAITVDGTDPQRARFAIGGVVDYPYCAAYPAAAVSGYAWDTGNSQGSATVLLPAVQHYTPGSFDPAAGVMLGYATEESEYVAFHNAMAYLKVTVSGGSNTSDIKKIRVRSNIVAGASAGGAQAMSGAFNATFSEDGCTLESDAVDATSVTLDCGEGVAQGTAMVIALPVNTYTKGINLFIASADEKWQEVISTKVFAPEAGVMYATGVAFNGDGGTYEGDGIYTETDWNAISRQISINSACEEFKDGDGVYNLYNDITATTLQRFGGGIGWNSDFAGTLDGNDHSVTTTEMSVPLFTYISGTVKNLKIGGTRTSIANYGWGTAQLALDVQDGGLVENVESDYEVTAPPFDMENPVYYFGLLRYILPGGTVKGCVTKGSYVIPQSESTKGVYVIPFCSSNRGLIQNCRNEANVSFADNAVFSRTITVAPIVNNGSSDNANAEIDGFVNLGNVTVQGSVGIYVAGVVINGGGYIHNCAHGESGKADSKGVVNVTSAPESSGRTIKIGGIACFGDNGESIVGRYYNNKNYANMTFLKEQPYALNRATMGGIVADIRYGAYNKTETTNVYNTFDDCDNSGYLKWVERKVQSNTGTNVAVFLGGILGCVMPIAGVNSGGALIFTGATAEAYTDSQGEHPILNGLYIVVRTNCSNTGTLEMASGNSSAASNTATGARQVYVGGIAGFTYGIGNSNKSGSSNAHYAVIRGTQNGTIKVGSARTGCICAGGIVGGCCYTKVEAASATVTYAATTEQTFNGSALAAPLYRGMLGGIIGWAVKYSQVATVNAALTDNTGLLCSASIGDNTSLKGYAGITGNKSVHRTSTKETHSLTLASASTYNGEALTSAMCYGGGGKSL